MKVEVLTVERVKFKWWQWWSNWIDIAVFDYQLQPYLLQMSISRTNSKQFKVVGMTGSIFYKNCDTKTIGDLTQMGDGS